MEMEKEKDKIVELFVQTQAAAFSSEMAKRRKSEEDGEEGDGGGERRQSALNVNDLPDIMILQIFFFLSPEDLVKSSQVCRMWNNLSEDELLWRGFLKRDIHKWQMINHSLNPEVFGNPDILNFRDPQRKYSCKQIYWSCKPGKPEEKKEEDNPETREDIFSKSLASLWNFMARKKKPKVVLYGSGLNSLKGGRKLLGVILGVSSQKNSSEFQVTGLVPGGNSVGAGISIEFRGVEFTLITVYNSFKAEREASPDGFEFGRLLIRNYNGDSNASSRESSPPAVAPVTGAAVTAASTSSSSSSSTSPVAKLAPIFHRLFEDADAFVYVTDSCKVAEELEKEKMEVDAAARRQQHRDWRSADSSRSLDEGVSLRDPDVIRRPWEDELGILLHPHCHSKSLVVKAAPLLVLACRNTKQMAKAEDQSMPKFSSAFEIVQTFQKKYLLSGRPWQVNSVDISNASGVTDGFQWIVNRCR